MSLLDESERSLPPRDRATLPRPTRPTRPSAPDSPPSTLTPRRRWRPSRVLALLVAPTVLAGLGAWGLTRQGAYGVDESATRWAALLPLHDLFHLLSHVDAVHGLYYLAMHGEMAFGHGPLSLRLPSLVAAVATAGVVSELGRRLSGSAVVGVAAGLVYAISPWVMYYAQTARSYAIVSLLIACATLLLVLAIEAEQGDASNAVVIRRWCGYAALIAVAGWLNEMALIVIAAHAVTLLVTGYPWRLRLHWLTAALLSVLAVSPLYVISSGQQAALDWVTRPTGHDLATLLRDYFGPHALAMVVTIGCALVACVPSRYARSALSFGTGREAWRTRGPVGLVSVALPLLAVPPVLLLAESEVGQPLYVDRYLLYTVIGAVLLIAEGAVRLGRRAFVGRSQLWVWATAVVAVMFVFAVQIPSALNIRTPDSRIRDFGAPAKYLGEQARPGDGVLFFSSFFRLVALGYPNDFRHLEDVASAESPRASGTFRGVDAPFAVTEWRILSRQRIWVVGHAPFGQLPTTLDDQERNLLLHRYRLTRYLPFHGLTVTLWVRRPRPTEQPPW